MGYLVDDGAVVGEDGFDGRGVAGLDGQHHVAWKKKEGGGGRRNGGRKAGGGKEGKE